MKLILVSSLETHCRNQGVEHLAAHFPQAVLVCHDLLEGDRLLRQIGGSATRERVEIQLDHACVRCAVHAEIMPTLLRLVPQGPEGVLVMALPATWHSDQVMQLLMPELQARGLSVSSVALALDPASLENHLWDRHTLWESGFNAMAHDDRTAGEFLFHEFMLADCLIPAEGLGARLLGPHAASERRGGADFEQGLALLAQMAPHAALCRHGDELVLGGHDWGKSALRARPGHVPAARRTAGSEAGRRIELRADRPLHPARFKEALPSLAESAACIRGTVWIASAPATRIALGAAGPRVWMESTGAWGEETAVTRLMLLGSEHDPQRVRQSLESCQLTDAEMGDGWHASVTPGAHGLAGGWEEVNDEGAQVVAFAQVHARCPGGTPSWQGVRDQQEQSPHESPSGLIGCGPAACSAGPQP